MVTGFTPEQNAGILMREGNLCAMFGSPGCRGRADTHANHRLNRGAGGSKLRNMTANGCAICGACNIGIEAIAELAAEARRRGVKLREGDDPEQIPMWVPFYRQWCQLIGDELRLTGITDALLDAHDVAAMISKDESAHPLRGERSPEAREADTKDPVMTHSTDAHPTADTELHSLGRLVITNDQGERVGYGDHVCSCGEYIASANVSPDRVIEWHDAHIARIS